MSKENNKNQLAVVKNNYLAKVSSTLSITDKLLNEINSRNAVPSDNFRIAIPDVNFQRYLSEELGIDVTDRTVSYGDVKEVSEVDISSSSCSIKSIDGIEYFVGLTILDCNNNNQLTNLDVSKNPALTSLVCSENQLTNLNISKKRL